MGIRGDDFDDDAYYADLEKWILKLMGDDDDKEDCTVGHAANICGYGISGSVSVNRRPESAYVACWGLLKKGGSVGTGVFIPQINNPGRVVAKNEKGRDTMGKVELGVISAKEGRRQLKIQTGQGR